MKNSIFDQFGKVEQIATAQSGNYYLVSDHARFMDKKQYFVFKYHASEQFYSWPRVFGTFSSNNDIFYEEIEHPSIFGDS